MEGDPPISSGVDLIDGGLCMESLRRVNEPYGCCEET